MKVLLTRSDKPISYAIRCLSWSRFSHVAIVMEDNETVVDSTFKHGVKAWKTHEFLANHEYVVMVEVEGDPNKALQYLGQGYDFTGIAGIGFKRKWNKAEKWFCSELTAVCMPMVFRQDRLGRVTPEHVYMVSRGYTIIKQGKRVFKWSLV